jgi:hypothetical protein
VSIPLYRHALPSMIDLSPTRPHGIQSQVESWPYHKMARMHGEEITLIIAPLSQNGCLPPHFPFLIAGPRFGSSIAASTLSSAAAFPAVGKLRVGPYPQTRPMHGVTHCIVAACAACSACRTQPHR